MTDGPDPRAVTVADVRLWAVVQRVDEPVRMSFGSLRRRAMAVVEVRTSDGDAGLGETWVNYPSWALHERSATVVGGIRPLLRGLEVDLADVAGSIAAVQASLVAALWPLGRQWGAPGAVLQAISGADQALWDAAGRLLGVSAGVLAAGRRRDRVPVYASGIGPDDVAEQVRRCRQAGLQAVKLRVGFDPDLDRANLAAARRALGADGELLVDANQAWSLDQALTMADALLSAGVAWVEEPIADGTVEDWAALRRRTGLAVAVGENVYGRRDWTALLASPDVAVVQPDVSKQGGISELRWIAEQALACGKVVEPHLYGGALAYAATLQVAACCPAVTRVELDVRPNPVRDGLLTDPPAIVDGEVVIPDGPGLGVTLVPEAQEHTTAYRCRTVSRPHRPRPPGSVPAGGVNIRAAHPGTYDMEELDVADFDTATSPGPTIPDQAGEIVPGRMAPGRGPW